MFFTNSTNIYDVYGGGGRLFGGTYIICLYIGMLFGKYHNFIKNKLSKLIVIILGILLIIITALLWYLLCVNGFTFALGQIFGSGLNPPGLWLMMYAISMMMMIFFLEKCIVLVVDKMNRVVDFLAFIGTKTLDVFLYHILFRTLLGPELQNVPILLKNIMIYTIMLGGPIMIGYVLTRIKKYIRECYKYPITR